MFDGKFIVQFGSPVPFVNYVPFVSVKFALASVAFAVTFSVLVVFMAFVGGGDNELLPVVEVFASLTKVILSRHGPT